MSEYDLFTGVFAELNCKLMLYLNPKEVQSVFFVTFVNQIIKLKCMSK